MSKLWKQFASMTLAAFFMISVATRVVFPNASEAQTPAPCTGIDPSLLNKAKAGDAPSQASVARTYLSRQDYPQAALWYRKAADQGLAKAQFELGVLYYKGQGVQQDKSLAVSWFRKAADQGNPKAQCALGWQYQHYWGAGEDHAQSVLWYRKAADQGLAKAQFELGKIYHEGDGVPQDSALAELWTRKAAEQGDVNAQKLLPTLVAINASHREERNRLIFAFIGLVVLTWLGAVLARYRERLVRFIKKFIPRTLRARQLTALLLVAFWCSAACLYQFFNPWMTRHPVDAAATALLFSAPAVIFGAVYLWWLSQSQNDS